MTTPIVDDLATENKLTSEYQQLLASAKIMFEGEERNLSQLEPFIQSTDRTMRKRASESRYGFFSEHEDKLDDIYDQWVKVRTKIAKQLGYARMSRTDYNAEMVAKFRTQVLTYIVPAAEKLRERQRDRLGLDTLQYYDTEFQFESGNPTPKGSPEWIVDNGRKMHSELSVETDKFFQFMIDNGLMDLVSKKGKADRGYCTYLSKYKAPFIFSENEYLKRGGFWHQQSHIFRTPFYYIDYALAQICALQFWKRMHEDRDSAWADYVKLCKQGGSKSFTELVKVANLISPFEDGCVKSVIGVIEDWLDKIDDKKL